MRALPVCQLFRKCECCECWGKEAWEGDDATLINLDGVENLKAVFIWNFCNGFVTIMKFLEIF